MSISTEQNMFSHLGVDRALIPTLKKRVGSKYHHLYSFLYSSFSSSVSPFSFLNMTQVVTLIIEGILQKKAFYILGDKDADGVSAISILKTYIEEQGCKVYYNMPLDSETYGSSARMLNDIQSKKEELHAVITVDMGIKEFDLAIELKKIHLPLIITDHHTPDEDLPETPYIINPHLNKDIFFPICGAYVALKLVQALFLAKSAEYKEKILSVYYQPAKQVLSFSPVLSNIFSPSKDNYNCTKDDADVFLKSLEQVKALATTEETHRYLQNLYPEQIKNLKTVYILEHLHNKYRPLVQPKKPRTFYPQSPTYGILLFTQEWLQTDKLEIEKHLSISIQIAGIATICDRMPMNHFENRGIVKTAFLLFYQDKNHPFFSMVKSAQNLLDFTTNIVPMQFCPLLNAGGRLGKANLVVDFLSCSQEQRLESTQKLTELNKERQKKQKIGLQEVETYLELDLKHPYILYASENIHKGVTGIIANKLSKVHKKPVFILSIQKEQSIMVGSARSSFTIHTLLEGTKELFLSFGGHKKACGFSLPIQDFSKLESYLNSIEWKELKTEDIQEEQEVYSLDIQNCSSLFYQSLELLDPYGEEHLPPIFKTQSTIIAPEVFGKNSTHLKWIPKDQNFGQFIFWNALDSYPLEDLAGKEKTIYFTIQKNTFYKNRYDFIVQRIK